MLLAGAVVGEAAFFHDSDGAAQPWVGMGDDAGEAAGGADALDEGLCGFGDEAEAFKLLKDGIADFALCGVFACEAAYGASEGSGAIGLADGDEACPAEGLGIAVEEGEQEVEDVRVPVLGRPVGGDGAADEFGEAWA